MTTERKSYSSNKFQLELPYLIEVQKASYEQFLQKEISPEKRLKVGLERVFPWSTRSTARSAASILFTRKPSKEVRIGR